MSWGCRIGQRVRLRGGHYMATWRRDCLDTVLLLTDQNDSVATFLDSFKIFSSLMFGGPEHLVSCSDTLRAGRLGLRIPIGATYFIFSTAVRTFHVVRQAFSTVGTTHRHLEPRFVPVLACCDVIFICVSSGTVWISEPIFMFGMQSDPSTHDQFMICLPPHILVSRQAGLTPSRLLS